MGKLNRMFVKRIALDEFGKIKEIEFYDTVPIGVDELKMFVELYNSLQLDKKSVLYNGKPINE